MWTSGKMWVKIFLSCRSEKLRSIKKESQRNKKKISGCKVWDFKFQKIETTCL